MKKLLLLLLTVMATVAFAQDAKPQWNTILSGSPESFETQKVSSLESSITITALAKPSVAGTVSGAGEYEYGSSCTLTATPSADYQFVNWTKNGVMVSTNASYSFIVTEAATYVANFCTLESIDVTVGSGNLTNSYLPTYSYYKYSFTEQIYTADELGDAGVITAVSFKVSNSKSTTRTVDLYMKSTTKTSFASKTDWEELTSIDKVYSGEVTFNASGWTTITLSTPFIFDGTSNLVIGMDDNTGSYVSSSSNSPKFYVYSTGANRALRIYGDNTNYSPAAPSGYNGSYITSNDQLMLSVKPIGGSNVVVDSYDILAMAEPREGGIVEGSGSYEAGTVVTLTATANEDYNFINWTKDNEVVSTETSYTFTVVDDAVYVANFEEIILTTYYVTVSEVENGAISADKTRAIAGETVALTATPDVGCTFSHWIVYVTGDINNTVSVNDNEFIMPEADVTVAALFTSSTGNVITNGITIGSGNATSAYLPTYAYYRYSFTEQIYTPEEIGEAGTITAIAYKVSNAKSTTRNVDLYLKHTSKNVFTNRTNWDPVTSANKVYSGEVTFNASGWTVITLNTPFVYDGTSNLLIAMDDNSGTYVSGSSNSPKFYVYSTGSNRAIRVYGDNINYDPNSLTSYNGTPLTSCNQIQLMMTTFEGGSTVEETLFVTPNVLSDFTYVYDNGPSEAQSFAVIGANLSNAVTITAPSDYEISTSVDGPYDNTLIFTGDRTRSTGVYVWDFEESLEGWTTIDADGDTYNWVLASELMSEYLIIPHSGENMLSSESYSSSAAAALTPDNWLVSPQVPLGGVFTMYAKAQDDQYPNEHFGIYVSTVSNDNTDDFTMINEWTIVLSRTSSPWEAYSVDLSAYANQMGYIAVRHFNCSDEFYLDVDDFSLTYDDTPPIPEPNPVHIDFLTANVYVRLKAGLDQGSYNEIITVTSGENAARVALNGAVTGRNRMDRMTSVAAVKTPAVMLYPNPVTHGENFRIAIPEDVSLDGARVEVYNELGVLVHTETFTGQSIDNKLAVGLYTVRVVDTKGNVHYSKLMVK